LVEGINGGTTMDTGGGMEDLTAGATLGMRTMSEGILGAAVRALPVVLPWPVVTHTQTDHEMDTQLCYRLTTITYDHP
jgi:hypothetical protein